MNAVRVLVVAAPLSGHVLPLVPFAIVLRAARAAGLRSAAAEVRAEIGAIPDPTDVAAAVLAGVR